MKETASVHLGFEIGSGAPVRVPLRHMAVTGQTQQSGKTTTLEALIGRAGVTALTFVTKRGEAAFQGGHRVKPYFHDRADWKFVDELLEAVLHEKNKFLRPWIMRICRNTGTLREVQHLVRQELKTAKGINHGVFTQLDAYLDMVVPEIARAQLADRLDLSPGLNVMDVSDFATPMQMLFIQSALDWINARCRDTTVVIPEAWEFVPQGKGSPVKKSAETLVRKGGGLGNHIWLDSQDMAGVDKMVLRACTVWLIGVQREANEVKRNIANIPAGMRRPKPEDIAALEIGQFFACFDKTIAKVYVQPAWLMDRVACDVARGEVVLKNRMEADVNEQEARALRAANADLQQLNAELLDKVGKLEQQINRLMLPASRKEAAPLPDDAPAIPRTRTFTTAPIEDHIEDIYAEIKSRLENDPGLLVLLTQRPELQVRVERKRIEVSGDTINGRVAKLLSEGFFDAPRSANAAMIELRKRGHSHDPRSMLRACDAITAMGFLTREKDGYQTVADMRVNVVEAA